MRKTKIKTNRKSLGYKTLKNLQSLINYGDLMANVLYNLRQKAGDSISENSQTIMKDLYGNWDNARTKLPHWIFKSF